MKKKKRKSAVVNAVVTTVEEIWKGKGLPIRSHWAVFLRVEKLVDKVDHVKISKRRHETDSIFIEEIGKEHDKLFDISEKAAPEAMEVDVEPGPSIAEPVKVVEDLGKRKINVPERFLDAEVIHITSTLLSRQNKRNLCYGPIQVTSVLRNFYCNF